MRFHRALLYRGLALVFGSILAAVTVTAASAQEATTEVGSDVASFGVGDWVNLGVRLALVVAVIWGAVHAMRWYVRRMNRGANSGLRALEILETHALGPNRTLHLVRLGDRAVLVGATQERITQLLTVDDPEEFQRLIATPEDADIVETPRGMRGASAMTLIGGLRTGLVAMRARQSAMNERMRAQREAQRAAQREVQREAGEARLARGGRRPAARASAAPRSAARPTTPRRAVLEGFEDEVAPSGVATPRFGALKGMLGRGAGMSAKGRAARAAESAAEEAHAAAEARQSLFDRTLASIEAVEVMPNGSTAAGPRARASYGATRTAPPASLDASRDAQIAALQRAISQARRSAS